MSNVWSRIAFVVGGCVLAVLTLPVSAALSPDTFCLHYNNAQKELESLRSQEEGAYQKEAPKIINRYTHEAKDYLTAVFAQYSLKGATIDNVSVYGCSGGVITYGDINYSTPKNFSRFGIQYQSKLVSDAAGYLEVSTTGVSKEMKELLQKRSVAHKNVITTVEKNARVKEFLQSTKNIEGVLVDRNQGVHYSTTVEDSVGPSLRFILDKNLPTIGVDSFVVPANKLWKQFPEVEQWKKSKNGRAALAASPSLLVRGQQLPKEIRVKMKPGVPVEPSAMVGLAEADGGIYGYYIIVPFRK